MTEIKHTPLPWKMSAHGNLSSGEDRVVFVGVSVSDREDAETKGNTEFMFKACNTHYDLIAALKEIIGVHIPDTDSLAPFDMQAIARAALEKVGKL